MSQCRQPQLCSGLQKWWPFKKYQTVAWPINCSPQNAIISSVLVNGSKEAGEYMTVMERSKHDIRQEIARWLELFWGSWTSLQRWMFLGVIRSVYYDHHVRIKSDSTAHFITVSCSWYNLNLDSNLTAISSGKDKHLLTPTVTVNNWVRYCSHLTNKKRPS